MANAIGELIAPRESDSSLKDSRTKREERQAVPCLFPAEVKGSRFRRVTDLLVEFRFRVIGLERRQIREVDRVRLC
jgi:hypothetical protein